MSTQSWTIESLLIPTPNPTLDRKDSATSELISQLNQYKGFDKKAGNSEKYAASCSLIVTNHTNSYDSISTSTPKPVTIKFTPSIGSTCLSLYPRTKTFTYLSTITPESCLATDSDSQAWRITQTSSQGSNKTSPETTRITFEQLLSDGTPSVVYKNCIVQLEFITRRGSSADFGRKLSVGHFSSGLAGFMLPISPVA
jgi:hypothetical protein